MRGFRKGPGFRKGLFFSLVVDTKQDSVPPGESTPPATFAESRPSEVTSPSEKKADVPRRPFLKALKMAAAVFFLQAEVETENSGGGGLRPLGGSV